MKRGLLILLLISMSAVMGAGVGVYFTHRILASEFAMSELTNDLSVLGYLESSRIEDAHKFLRRQVEVHIATIERSGRFESGADRRVTRDKWIERYAKISESHPTMKHDYDPEIRNIVDGAIDRVRKANNY